MKRQDAVVEREVLVHHAVGVEAVLDRRAHRDPVEPADAGTAATASSSEETRKPFSPSRMISGIEPRGWAITGVPHAIASTTLKPKGSLKLTRWRSARAPPSRLAASVGTDRPDVYDPLPVEPGLHGSLEVLLVLDDPGDDQRQIGSFGHVDRLDGPFLGMDPPKNRR